ncbi:MAG TPA: hypothetical protein DEB30_02410, partial [Candidatus Peribacter riflensis]|nr:hypothetical protein [Candidatus Peribacter riflensis]
MEAEAAVDGLHLILGVACLACLGTVCNFAFIRTVALLELFTPRIAPQHFSAHGFTCVRKRAHDVHGAIATFFPGAARGLGDGAGHGVGIVRPPLIARLALFHLAVPASALALLGAARIRSASFAHAAVLGALQIARHSLLCLREVPVATHVIFFCRIGSGALAGIGAAQLVA